MPASILQRAAQGEQPAMRECIDRYGGLVWSLVRASCRQADTEDAVQEIFVELWRSASRFDPSVASETTFVAMIARRRLIDRRRREARRPQGEVLSADPPDIQPTPAEAPENAEDARRAALALEQLKPQQRRLLQLSIYHGLSHDKIAEATGLPLGTVKTHIRRGLIQLRDILTGAAPMGVTP